MPTEPVATFQSHARSPSLRLLARISQYELLSRMWTEKSNSSLRQQLPVTYARDFAYADSVPMILSSAQNNISDVSAKDFAELLSGPTVEVLVGRAKRRWTLHRNLLCHHSTFFEAQLMGGEVPKSKRPPGDQKLELLGDDPAGFELFVKWLYQGRLNDTAELSDVQKYEYAVACHKLYLLCEKFEMPELKNLSMDQYRQCLFEAQLVPDADEINDIYKISPEKSPFRKLMTQIAARQIMDPDSDKDAETYRTCFHENPDFAVDMVNAIKKGTGGVLFDDPTDGDDCEYHDHREGAACRLRPRVNGELISSLDTTSPFSTPLGAAGDGNFEAVDHWHPHETYTTRSLRTTRITNIKAQAQTSAATSSTTRMQGLTDEDLSTILKALPTTSTASTDSSHSSDLSASMTDSVMEEDEKDETTAGVQPPPPTPAKPGNQVKSKQMELALSSAMGSMDIILTADRTRQQQQQQKAGAQSGNPLNYVAALRLRQEQGRRNSRDLFEGVEG